MKVILSDTVITNNPIHPIPSLADLVQLAVWHLHSFGWAAGAVPLGCEMLLTLLWMLLETFELEEFDDVYSMMFNIVD